MYWTIRVEGRAKERPEPFMITCSVTCSSGDGKGTRRRPHLAIFLHHIVPHNSNVHIARLDLPHNIGCPLEPDLHMFQLQGGRTQGTTISGARPLNLTKVPKKEAKGKM
jgi:hypothetical protein